MTVKLVGSTSGSVSLQAPASTSGGAHRVLTLPDANATLATTSDTFGKILQVQQTLKVDAFSMNSASFTDVTGITATMTPSSSSNKILVKLVLNYGGEANGYYVFKLFRGSTHIGVSTAVSLSNQINGTFAGTTGHNDNSQYKCDTAAYEILDTPSTTSATTYKIQVYSYANRYFYLNRPYNNDNQDYIFGGTSTMTLMEVAA